MKLTNYLRNYTAEHKLYVRRALLALILVFILTCLLIVNLYNLQIVHYTDYQTRSNYNRIKLVPIPPSRGIIYDRNGIPLAVNRTVYQIEMIPNKIKNISETLKVLRTLLDIKDNDIDIVNFKRTDFNQFSSKAIKSNLTEVQVARFSVNQYKLQGLKVKEYERRYYPYGSALTHVIGYISKINDKDIERLDKYGKLANYAATNDIGKLGIERYYEDLLHGHPGYEEIEVNNRGKVIRTLKKFSPQAGQDIYLTLDLKLQQYIDNLLTGSRAAVIVTDPRTGSILALVSTPSYDPNMFVDGISSKNYLALLNDPNQPLVNRATQGVYPPASTVKPYVAVSALSASIINNNTKIFDTGWWQLPGSDKRYRDWKKLGHGNLNVTKSLEESADTFFYQVAYNMGIDSLSKWMGKFGYGQYTGIDLIEESSGNMPTREWKIKRFKKQWYHGDTISVGIGQGYWTATPIQMNKALMILINNGIVKIPHLLMSTLEEGKHVPWIQQNKSKVSDINPVFWKIAKDGMYGAANRSNGTANKYFANAPYKVAAKSGTAQVFSLKYNETYNEHRITERLRDHKLMTAFAPYDNPRVAVSIILENGGSGKDAGTIMRKILDYIFLNKINF